MIQHRTRKGQLRIRNTPYGREVVFIPANGNAEMRKRFIDKLEAAKFYEAVKKEMEE